MGGTRQSNLILSLPYFSWYYTDLAFTAHAEHTYSIFFANIGQLTLHLDLGVEATMFSLNRRRRALEDDTLTPRTLLILSAFCRILQFL